MKKLFLEAAVDYKKELMSAKTAQEIADKKNYENKKFIECWNVIVDGINSAAGQGCYAYSCNRILPALMILRLTNLGYFVKNNDQGCYISWKKIEEPFIINWGQLETGVLSSIS